MSQTLQLKRETASWWTSNNPTLAVGEPGFESDTGRLKIGDGATAWSSLPYLPTTANALAISGTPTTGQVLTATSGTAANWQTPSGGGGGAASAPPVLAAGTVTSSLAVDMATHSAGCVVSTATLTSATACTISVSNVPTGRACIELVITNPASGTIPALTFPGTTIPATPPPLSTGLGERTVYTLVTYDGGTTWWVYLAGAGL